MNITEEMLEESRDLIANGEFEAAGYRVVIKMIDATASLEISQKSEFEHLGKAGFQTKTDEQTERESKGSHYGIVVHVGEFAYKSAHLGGSSWVELGQTVIVDRYAGVEIEIPPGSGDKYRFTNDESMLGRFKPKNED